MGKKKRKHLQQYRRKLILCILISLLADLVFILLQMKFYQSCIPLEEQQKREFSGVVEDAFVRKIRYSRILNVTIDGRNYKIHWKGGGDSADEYASYLRRERPFVTVTNYQPPPFLGLFEEKGTNVAISDTKYSHNFTEKNASLIRKNYSAFIGLFLFFGVPLLSAELLLSAYYGGQYRIQKRNKSHSKSTK